MEDKEKTEFGNTNEKLPQTEPQTDGQETNETVDNVASSDIDTESSTDTQAVSEEDSINETEIVSKEKIEDPILTEVSNADLATLSKDEMLKLIKKINASSKILELKDQVEEIKNSFYKIHRAEINEKKEKFVEEGGLPEDFKIDDIVETEFKAEYKKYRDQKTKISENFEKEKQSNLAKKFEIIEEIKNLVNQKESINKTFHDFRDLQEKWKEIGIVPQSEIKNIWESYHLAVGQFYDYIKINKELRDLDLKKNLEAKIKLCEHAESLLIEPSVVKAFADLQLLHDQWREIGPVPHEKKNELWERFKSATSQINKRHQEHFINLKEQEKSNLIAKQELCDKVEAILEQELVKQKQWTEKSDEVIELQKIWRTIGFAPKKYNNDIYARFRKACDTFFSNKRAFFEQLKDTEEENKQRKIELCIEAEKLKDDTDWKKTTDDFIRLQNEWKNVGPVSRRDSEKLWKRFRSACDVFFNAKSAHFSTLDQQQDDNLKLKLALIEEIDAFELSDDHENNLELLKDFQRRWSEIGFVPFKEKDRIQNKFRDALNKKFESLSMDSDKKKILKYRVKLENISQSKNSEDKISSERNKLYNKLKKLQNDIVTLENNIGFFSNSNNASSLIKDVENKIEKGKKEIELIKEQIKMLDNADEDQ